MPSPGWLIDHKPELYAYALAQVCRGQTWNSADDPVVAHLVPDPRQEWYLYAHNRLSARETTFELRSWQGGVNCVLARGYERGFLHLLKDPQAGRKLAGRNITEAFVEARGWAVTLRNGRRSWTPPRAIAGCDNCPNLLACSLEGVLSP